MISINRQACDGCGLCIEACPTGALQFFEGLIQVDGNLCEECELCIDTCPQDALVSSTIVEEVPALVPMSIGGVMDRAGTNDPKTEFLTKAAVTELGSPKRSLGDWLGAAFNFLVFDLGPAIEGIIDTGQTRNGRQKRTIRRNESTFGERRGRGGNRRKARRRKRGQW